MLTSVFISAEDTTSQSENRKKSAKKDFEIDFDDDIDFHVYFRKTKVCAGFFCLFDCFAFRAAPVACGGSQARGRIGATAASLHHSLCHVGSEPHLQPTPQLKATPDP